jgi:hypothetical protein
MAAATLAVTREVDGRGAATATGAPTTAAWLRAGLHVHPAAAKREVALAGALAGDCAATGAALRGGDVSAAQAEAIADAVASLPASVPARTRRDGEAFLLEQARVFGPGELARLGRHLLHAVDPGLGARLERDERDRAEGQVFTLVRRPDGSRDARGRFDAEAGALLDAALDAVAGPRPTTDGGPDLRCPARRRAEGLLELVRMAVASPDLPDAGGEPVTVTVTVPLATLESRLQEHARRAGSLWDADRGGPDVGGPDVGGPDVGGGWDVGGVPAAVLEDGTALSAESARRLACDAFLVPVVLGADSAVLDGGRLARAVPRPMRRALVARDGGCAFPGCDRPPRWCQAHHVQHWSQGGATALGNLVLLCGHHHRVVHHHGWVVHIGPDGLPAFTPPRWVDPGQVPISRPWRRALDRLSLRT